MCSKTSSESYGDEYSGLCPKKQKHNGRRRVPRRGPGVAELEKIRLEEQHNSTPAPLLPPSTTTSPVYPVSSYLPTGSFPYDLIPPAPVFHKKHDPSLHYLPPMNLPNPGSGGFYQFIEPPSNQTSCLHNLSKILDEDKIVTAKRPWHFIADTTKCTVGTTTTRDGTRTRSVDLRLKTHVQDSGNSITFDSPSHTPHPTPVIPKSPLDFPRFIQYQQKEEFDHEIMPGRIGAHLYLNRKPFYSFLPSNDQDSSFSLKSQRYDTLTDHAIDLRLKL